MLASHSVGYQPPDHQFHPRDAMLICCFKTNRREPLWKDPYVTTSQTPTAVQITDAPPWIYQPDLKKAPEVQENPKEADCD